MPKCDMTFPHPPIKMFLLEKQPCCTMMHPNPDNIFPTVLFRCLVGVACRGVVCSGTLDYCIHTLDFKSSIQRESIINPSVGTKEYQVGTPYAQM